MFEDGDHGAELPVLMDQPYDALGYLLDLIQRSLRKADERSNGRTAIRKPKAERRSAVLDGRE
jgi:hypothetical protein